MTTTDVTVQPADQIVPRVERPVFLPGPPTVYDAIDEIQSVLDPATPDQPRRVLDAGCGSMGYLRLRPDDRLTGIDISEVQLHRNDALDEKILGDVQTYPLPREHFDLIVCWYVLEHVPYPAQAVRNMISSLRPGGLLVIAVPSVASMKGLITKFTPHWFHVLVHRHLFRRVDAGREGHPPFPTYMRWSLRLSAMERIAGECGMDVVMAKRFEDYTQRELRTRSNAFRWIYRIARVISAALTLDRWNILLTDYAIVLRRP